MTIEVLFDDGERRTTREVLGHTSGRPASAIIVVGSTQANAELVAIKLQNEHALRRQLDNAWAVRPVCLSEGKDALTLEDPGGEILAAFIDFKRPFEESLNICVAIAKAVAQMHEARIVHRDIRPASVLLDRSAGVARLTGFGVATSLTSGELDMSSREVAAGSLAYMAPEQTGRMGRAVDMRTDLYSLGATLYQIMVGSPPFEAVEPLEWVHCHTARTPVSPTLRDPAVPEIVSALILKLLSKRPEDRYQTAAGVHFDLQKCQEEWCRTGRVQLHKLGLRDGSARLRAPPRLYGREKEVGRLQAALDRVVSNAASEVVLISGYSGTGKTALVREFGGAVLESNGILISGKLDQYTRDIPYAPVAAALRGVVRYFQSKPQAELEAWRSDLRDALGTHGGIITGLVPGLDQILGEQSLVEDLSGPEAKAKFNQVFLQFLATIASPSRPLVLFLDDLQWLDAATLEIFEVLATSEKVSGLLLIGAYRENEVGPSHPLGMRLEKIKRAGHHVEDVSLKGVGLRDVEQILVDGFGVDSDEVRRLATIAYDKTQGNPFFALQLVGALADEGLVAYQPSRHDLDCQWEKIRGRRISENIVTLTIDRLTRLSADALRAIKVMACLGNSCDSRLIARVAADREQQIVDLMHEPIEAGLLVLSEDSYSFSHDRVQEAAYALLTEDERLSEHRRIGRTLLEETSPGDESLVFEVASQLNRGLRESDPREERMTASAVCHRAGKKARTSTAYKAAVEYLTASIQHLGKDAWREEPETAFALHLERAECVFLGGDFAEAEQEIVQLLMNSRERDQLAMAHRLKVELHVVRSEYDLAVRSALDALRVLGIEMTAHPTWDDVLREYEMVRSVIGDQPVEFILDLPEMQEPSMIAASRLLTELEPPAFFTDYNLTVLTILKMVRLSLSHGNPDSAQGYALFGWILGPAFGQYEEGWRMAQLALRLSERGGTPLDSSRVRQILGWTSGFTQPLSTSTDWLRRAYQTGTSLGDLYFSTYAAVLAAQQLLMSGKDLEEVTAECEAYLAAASRIGFQDATDLILSVQRAVASLRGRTRALTDFSGVDFDEAEFERRLTASRMHILLCWYWTLKAMLFVFSGDYVNALICAKKAKPPERVRIVQVQQVDYHFYAALAIAGVLTDPSTEHRDTLFAELLQHHAQLANWAAETDCETFADKACLVGAELARLERRDLEAEQLYDESVRLARMNGFKNHEGLANEIAARFYRNRGAQNVAQLLLEEARQCYAAWGALALVGQLNKIVQQRRERPGRPNLAASESDVDLLDLATVVKVSNALSREMVLGKIVDTLMRTSLENAGAERAVLLLMRGGQHQVEAEARTVGGEIEVRLRQEESMHTPIPESIVQYVVRTSESVILDDAIEEPAFWSDSYIRSRKARSIVCLPLRKETRVVGLLYLENNLFPSNFSSSRLAILKLLASQAAISLENTYLYEDLEARESKIRRLVESNVVGVAEWDLSGVVQGANDAFLNMFGYERDELESGDIRWRVLTPPEWSACLDDELRELSETGALQPREREIFHKNGMRIPVILGAAKFDGSQQRGVALIVDIRRQKAAEARALEGEINNRRLQSELAHANRVLTIGQIATWIAHDVKQPLAGLVASASAGVRWLSGEEPNLSAARYSLERVIRDGHRANEVLDRIRSLVKKAPPRLEVVDLNAVVIETISLIRQEASRTDVVVRTDLFDRLAAVEVDRVQIQQVLLNLLVNAVEALSTTESGERVLTVSSAMMHAELVRVSVEDTGPGLLSTEPGATFEAFYTTKENGLGMGLAICKSIVESFEGQIWVEEKHPGVAFSFSLPAVKAAPRD